MLLTLPSTMSLKQALHLPLKTQEPHWLKWLETHLQSNVEKDHLKEGKQEAAFMAIILQYVEQNDKY